MTYRGANSSAGEWGHTKIAIGGRGCRCGGRGCLEAYIGAEAVLERAGVDFDTSTEQAAFADLVTSGSPVVDETVEYLGAGLANLINLFNPERIVVGGWAGLLLGQNLLTTIKQKAAENCLTQPYSTALDRARPPRPGRRRPGRGHARRGRIPPQHHLGVSVAGARRKLVRRADLTDFRNVRARIPQNGVKPPTGRGDHFGHFTRHPGPRPPAPANWPTTSPRGTLEHAAATSVAITCAATTRDEDQARSVLEGYPRRRSGPPPWSCLRAARPAVIGSADLRPVGVPGSESGTTSRRSHRTCQALTSRSAIGGPPPDARGGEANE